MGYQPDYNDVTGSSISAETGSPFRIVMDRIVPFPNRWILSKNISCCFFRMKSPSARLALCSLSSCSQLWVEICLLLGVFLSRPFSTIKFSIRPKLMVLNSLTTFCSDFFSSLKFIALFPFKKVVVIYTGVVNHWVIPHGTPFRNRVSGKPDSLINRICQLHSGRIGFSLPEPLIFVMA